MYFKTYHKKILILVCAVALLFPVTVVKATTQNIDATANFQAAITLSGSNLDFSDVIYSATPSAGGDFVFVNAAGAASYGGVFSAGTGASPAAGDVTITAGTNGATIEARCDNTAVLTNGAGSTVNIAGTTIAAENATGSASNCLGVGGGAAKTLVLNIGTLDSFKIGGVILGTGISSFAGGAHSTANAGGDDIQVDITYQ